MLPQGRFYDILTTYRAATLTLRFYHESNRENRGFVFLFDNRAKSDWLIFKNPPLRTDPLQVRYCQLSQLIIRFFYFWSNITTKAHSNVLKVMFEY
jgi:hypothetical protein